MVRPISFVSAAGTTSYGFKYEGNMVKSPCVWTNTTVRGANAPQNVIVDGECLKRLDPDGNGKFDLNTEFPIVDNLPFRVVNAELYNKLKKSYDGKVITPELVDNIVNTMLDCHESDMKKYNRSITLEDGEGNLTTYTPLSDIKKYSKYLKPETLDRAKRLLKDVNF